VAECFLLFFITCAGSASEIKFFVGTYCIVPKPKYSTEKISAKHTTKWRPWNWTPDEVNRMQWKFIEMLNS